MTTSGFIRRLYLPRVDFSIQMFQPFSRHVFFSSFKSRLEPLNDGCRPPQRLIHRTQPSIN